jgi:hypothetical protein
MLNHILEITEIMLDKKVKGIGADNEEIIIKLPVI